MGLDSNDFLEDYTTDEFKQKAEQAVQQQTQEQQKRKAIEDRKMNADAMLAEANVKFTGAQTKNTADDNTRQLAISIDKHFQEWAELHVKAVKDGASLPPRPSFAEILQLATGIMAAEEQAQAPQPNQPIGGQ